MDTIEFIIVHVALIGLALVVAIWLRYKRSDEE
jgi:hypothetical protein